MSRAGRMAACLAMSLVIAAPSVAQNTEAGKSPAPPPAAESAFDVDTYSCQNVLDDLAAGRQSQIGIAVVVIYAQQRAVTSPEDHHFSLTAIQRVAAAAGGDCATGDHNRLLRDVVSQQMTKLKTPPG